MSRPYCVGPAWAARQLRKAAPSRPRLLALPVKWKLCSLGAGPQPCPGTHGHTFKSPGAMATFGTFSSMPELGASGAVQAALRRTRHTDRRKGPCADLTAQSGAALQGMEQGPSTLEGGREGWAPGLSGQVQDCSLCGRAAGHPGWPFSMEGLSCAGSSSLSLWRGLEGEAMCLEAVQRSGRGALETGPRRWGGCSRSGLSACTFLKPCP